MIYLNKVRVLIWPEQEQYAAECLELSTIVVNSTKEEAATRTTKLIDELFSHVIRKRVPLEKLLHPSSQQVQDDYLRAENFPFTTTEYLTPDVRAVVKEIEYRFYSGTTPDGALLK